MNQEERESVETIRESVENDEYDDKTAQNDLKWLLYLLEKTDPQSNWKECKNDLCGEFFIPKAVNQKYCSPSCGNAQRQREYYQRES